MESASQNPKSGQARRCHKMVRFWIAITVMILAAAAGAFFAFDRYRMYQLGSQVRGLFAAGQYESARPQLEHYG